MAAWVNLNGRPNSKSSKQWVGQDNPAPLMMSPRAGAWDLDVFRIFCSTFFLPALEVHKVCLSKDMGLTIVGSCDFGSKGRAAGANHEPNWTPTLAFCSKTKVLFLFLDFVWSKRTSYYYNHHSGANWKLFWTCSTLDKTYQRGALRGRLYWNSLSSNFPWLNISGRSIYLNTPFQLLSSFISARKT